MILRYTQLAMVEPKVGQIWINNEIQKKVTIAMVIPHDRILFHYTGHDGFTLGWNRFQETFTIDLKASIEHLDAEAFILCSESRKLSKILFAIEYPDPCPKCGEQLELANGGGVKCTCGYWFCY